MRILKIKILKKMFDYFQKYNNLPKDLRDKVGSADVVKAIGEIEKKFGVDLAVLVMKIMVKEVLYKNLENELATQFNLDFAHARELAGEMKEKIFKNVSDYLIKEEAARPVVLKQNIPLVSPKIAVPLAPTKAASESPKVFERQWIASKPEVKTSSFFFSAEDEEEVKKLAKKIDNTGQVEAQEDIEKRVGQVISETDINFGSEALSGRFKDIIRTYVKGIRNKVETRQALLKPIQAGGLGFDNDSVENVLNISSKFLSFTKIPSQLPPKKFILPEDKVDRNKLESLKKLGARDLEYDFSKMKPKEKEEEKKAEKPEAYIKLDLSHELPAPKIMPIQPSKKIEPAKIETEVRNKIDFRPLAPVSGKIKMEDVKQIPRAMGPIDELRYMDLINFHRLGKDPVAAANKIKEKIKLLEEEDYVKKVEAVRAWRQSPINKLYLAMGEASISQGKPVDVIIEERKSAKEDYLGTQEFEAVMDLNKSIRF